MGFKSKAEEDFDKMVEEFVKGCRSTLGDILGANGYVFVAMHLRFRGIVVEFSRKDDLFFVVNEGGVVTCDLIRHIPPAPYYRISLSQLLGYNGVRSVARRQNWDEKLALFAAELPVHAAAFLSDDEPAIDSRYCFPLTEKHYREYLGDQRGR